MEPSGSWRSCGHVARDADGRAWLQYWFFYYFNNKAFLGFGLHEGDWEMVQVGLDPRGRPTAMTFAQHDHGERCAWKQAEIQDGTRPVVYVARGSQASYPRAGRHRAERHRGEAGDRGERGHVMIRSESRAIDLVASKAVTLAWKARVAATMSTISVTALTLASSR